MTHTAKGRLLVAAIIVMTALAWFALSRPRSSAEPQGATVAATAGATAATAPPLDGVKPPCWRVGTDVEGLHVWRDPEVHFDGNASAALFASRSTTGHSSLAQMTSAVGWRGERVEFTAELRTRDAHSGAGLWVRLYDAGGAIVAFDNQRMPDLPNATATTRDAVYGDKDWTTVQIVIDVPDNAETISYGVFLVGTGTVWIDNTRIAVSEDVPVTGPAHPMPEVPGRAISPADLVLAPTNLGFEDIDSLEAGCPTPVSR